MSVVFDGKSGGVRDLMRFGRKKPTLTLITDAERRPYTSGEEASANQILMSRLLTAVMEEPMTEIFSVDLSHFIGELRNGYKDILIDLVRDSLRSTPYAGLVSFAGKGTFELDWNTAPVVRLEFIWNGPFYQVSFEMERRANERRCHLSNIETDSDELDAKAVKDFVDSLHAHLATNTP